MSGAVQDNAEVKRLLLAAADQGDLYAAFDLAEIYRTGGAEEPKDADEAAKWYRRAADQGYIPARMRLGRMLFYGDGVAADRDEAFRMFLPVAERGRAIAQAYVGLCYVLGCGVAQNAEQARRWIELSTRKDDLTAEYIANSARAFMYKMGFGVPQDLAEARKWFGDDLAHIITNFGEPIDRYELGLMEASGIGGAHDDRQAYADLAFAVDSGYSAASGALESLKETMSPQQILDAQQEAFLRWRGSREPFYGVYDRLDGADPDLLPESANVGR
jgi:hypothetical protein